MTLLWFHVKMQSVKYGKIYKVEGRIFYAASFLEGLKKGLEISKGYSKVTVRVSKVEKKSKAWSRLIFRFDFIWLVTV